MEGKGNYFLIGASIVSAFLLAAFFVIWLGGFEPNRSYARIDIGFVGPVRGLQQASEVRFNGIKVGEVRNLRIDPDAPTERVIATIRVDGAVPISAGTVAQLELNPITNVALIQLSGGDPKAPRIRGVDGKLPRLEGQPPQLDSLVMGGEDLLRNSNKLVLGANDVLTKENVRRFTRIMANLERLSARLAQPGGLIDNADRAARNFAAASASIDKVAGRGDVLADEATLAIIEARQAAASFRALGDSATLTMDDTSSAMPQLTASARDLQALAVKLETVADEIDRRRAGYLSGPSRPVRELPR